MNLRYASEEEIVEAPAERRASLPTAVGVACWMIAVFILALTLLT